MDPAHVHGHTCVWQYPSSLNILCMRAHVSISVLVRMYAFFVCVRVSIVRACVCACLCVHSLAWQGMTSWLLVRAHVCEHGYVCLYLCLYVFV